MSDKKIYNIITDSLEKLDTLADGNMVLGKPIITASGCQVIPFSKITLGNLSGGGEYGDVKIIKARDSFPFAGGSGSIVNMKPMGFLIDDGKGCHLLKITDEAIDNLIERAGEIVRDMIAKD